MAHPPPGRRACIHTLGCRLNQAESALLCDQLAAAGYVVVPFGEPADLGVVHTCTVTREADAKSRQMIRQFIRANPGARMVVIGCYAQLRGADIAAIPGVDLVLGNAEKMRLAEHLAALDAAPAEDRVRAPRLGRAPFTLPWTPDGPPVTRRMNLKIQDGCDFMCSYCIIPFARGRSRSRRLDDLVAEAASLAGRGARELILTGVNLGGYACDGKTLVDAVDRLNALPGVERIRISSIEMTTVLPGLLERMADPAHRLAPHLHLPLQSGSDRILAAMRRHYTRAEYLDTLRAAEAAVPGIGLGADVLAGFPGETEQDQADTLALIAESPLAYLHVFKYSPRQGSAAERLPEKADPETAKKGSTALRVLGAEKHRAFQERHLGKTVEVLFEDRAGGRWTGFTGNYLRVGVRSGEDLANRIGRVAVEAAHKDFVTGALDGPLR